MSMKPAPALKIVEPAQGPAGRSVAEEGGAEEVETEEITFS